MQNPNLNRLSITLSAQDVQDIQQHLDGIEQKMPFLLELTGDEIKRMPKIDVSNHDFVRETLNVLATEAIPLPNGVNASEIQKDYDLFDQLDQLSLRIEQLYKMVQHTRTLAGSEAYQSSLFVYKLIQAYAGAGMPGFGALNDRLKSRFSGQGGSGTTTETTDDSTV